jgi:hypothetical protein
MQDPPLALRAEEPWLLRRRRRAARSRFGGVEGRHGRLQGEVFPMEGARHGVSRRRARLQARRRPVAATTYR